MIVLSANKWVQTYLLAAWIVQGEDEKDEKEEEGVAHPNEWEQFQEMDANSSLSLLDKDISFE